MTMRVHPPPLWKIVAVLTVGTLAASTSAVIIRIALDASGARGAGFSLVLAASRLTLAALMLAPTWASFRGSSRSPQATAYSLGAGVFLALHFATWISSLSYTSIAASTSLVTTNPIWVALLSWLWFKEKPAIATLVGIVCAILGSLIISLGVSSADGMGLNPPLGNALALIGAIAVSIHFLLGREAQRLGLSVTHHVVLTYSTAALVLLPLPWVFGSSYRGHPPLVYGCILLLALFPQLVGHTSFNWAVRWVSPTLVALTILAEPVGSSLLAFILFQENPGGVVLAGAAVILLGVGVAALGTRPRKRERLGESGEEN
jgi:drug/metabolite transporter (DMT)-like permease